MKNTHYYSILGDQVSENNRFLPMMRSILFLYYIYLFVLISRQTSNTERPEPGETG